jgi:hypothetical protein
VDYEAAKMPLHLDLYPRQCGSCHYTDRWAPAHFSHPFPLDGQHALTACWRCHVGSPPVFAGTSSACVSCHLKDFQNNTVPGHSAFPTTCQDCHNTTAWK